MARRCVSLIGLLNIGLAGCRPEAAQPPPDVPPPAAATAAESQLILSPSVLDEAFLVGTETSVRWRFAGDEFVVETWNEPLPESLQAVLLQQAGGVYRIAGQWRLLDKGHRLQLIRLQADGPATVPQADLMIEQGPGETLIISGTTYRLLDHPNIREVLPQDRFRARFVGADAPDRVRLEHDGKIETLRLAGIVGPPEDHPLRVQAIERVEQLLRDARLHAHVFDPPEQSPRRAHVYAEGFRWVNLMLIDEGLAWHDKPNDNSWLFATHEDVARRSQVGIWSQPDSVPPWWTPTQKE
jgi:endonuclease YncB( thermonuclease family)